MAIAQDYVRSFLKTDFSVVYEREISDGQMAFLLPIKDFNILVWVGNFKDFIEVRIPNIIYAKKDFQAAIFEKAMELNNRLIIGRYGFDPEDGEVCFSVTQATDGFQPPWENYKDLLTRILGVALRTVKTEARAFREMNVTGRWPVHDETESHAPEQDPVYEEICRPALEGFLDVSDVPPGRLDIFLDLMIEKSIQTGLNKLEDYPPMWQEALRKRLDGGSGTDI